MKVKLDSKLCGVCGDKALGHNFNAITCESCKAFFRRNALVQKEFKCPFNEQCEITPITRRFCQKCRLDKCFSIGMCKSLIMSEEDKVLKRQKIQENRAKKKSSGHGFKSGFKKVKRDQSDDNILDSTSELRINSKKIRKGSITPQPDNILSYITNTDSDNSKDAYYEQHHSNNSSHINNIEHLNHGNDSGNSETQEDVLSQNEHLVTSSEDIRLETQIVQNVLSPSLQTEKVSDFSGSGFFVTGFNLENSCANNNAPCIVNRTPPATDVMEEVIRNVHNSTSMEPNPIESILCEAIKLEFETFSSLPQHKSNSRELNDAERAKLNELIVANKALLSPLDDEINNSILAKELQDPQGTLEGHPALLDVINLTAIVIRRLIKMAKKIHSFKNLCQEDQVALLKGGCTEIMILRSSINYDSKQQTWQIPRKQEALNLNADVLKLAKGNVYEEYEKFFKTFDPKWRADENIILIMCAITLFTPDRPKVVHEEVIKLEQNSYYYLLRRYLESVYPGCEAKSTFLKLIQKIGELHKFNEQLINVYLDVNPAQVEPLLIEIFDLKH